MKGINKKLIKDNSNSPISDGSSSLQASTDDELLTKDIENFVANDDINED